MRWCMSLGLGPGMMVGLWIGAFSIGAFSIGAFSIGAFSIGALNAQDTTPSF